MIRIQNTIIDIFLLQPTLVSALVMSEILPQLQVTP